MTTMWPLRNRHHQSDPFLLLFLLVCLSCQFHLIFSQERNPPGTHRWQGDRRLRTLRGRGQGLVPENSRESSGQVIIEEPEDTRRDSENDKKKRSDFYRRLENFVSPWEPPLFQWVYNPELLEKDARYFQWGNQDRGTPTPQSSDTRVWRGLQALSSTTEQRAFPETSASSPFRQRSYQRHHRPAGSNIPSISSLSMSSLPHSKHQIVSKLTPDSSPALPAPLPGRPKPAAHDVFTFSRISSPGEVRGAGSASPRQAPVQPQSSRVTPERRETAPAPLIAPPAWPASYNLRRENLTSVHREPPRMPYQSSRPVATDNRNDVFFVDAGQRSGANPSGVTPQPAFPWATPTPRQSHDADYATCQARLERCARSEQELRNLRKTYQENLETLKQLITDALNRMIRDPSQMLDPTVCDVIEDRHARLDPNSVHFVSSRDDDVTASRQDPMHTARGSTTPEATVTRDVRGESSGRSGQAGGDADSVGHTRDLHRLGQGESHGQGQTQGQGQGDPTLDSVDHRVSSSWQHHFDQRNVHEQGQGHGTAAGESGTRTQHGYTHPGVHSQENRFGLDSQQIRPGPERVESGYGIPRATVGSGTGVHFDDLEDLDEENIESGKDPQQVWEIWRQQQQQQEEEESGQVIIQEERVGPDCTLGEWTEWAGPVGFGVIERRRFVMGGDPECKANVGDLLMRVDISVFNANHTYYKPPEEVGQDFETDFTRSYVPRDLLLVIDASGSIEVEDFELIREGVSVMVDLFCGGFGTGPINNRMSIVMFASEIKIIHKFSDDQSVTTLRDAIANMTQPNGNTCTGDALKLAHDIIFAPGNGARPEVVHDTLLLTDGHSNCGEVTIQDGAQLLRSMSNIFALGVGIANDTDARWELNSVVSNNEPRHIFSLERFQDFKDMLRSIQERQKTLPCLPIVDKSKNEIP